MIESDLNAKIEKAEANWNEVVHGAPDGNAWGFFSYGDACGAIGGGVGMFTWFDSRAELLEFIASTLPCSPPGPSEADVDTVEAETRQIIDALSVGKLEDSEAVARLNRVLASFSHIEWIGTFEALLSGPHEYASLVRGHFRGRDADRNDTSPIQPQETTDFQDFLMTWGV